MSTSQKYVLKYKLRQSQEIGSLSHTESEDFSSMHQNDESVQEPLSKHKVKNVLTMRSENIIS